MPTYSYACEKCSHSFELFFYIKDYVEHPSCPQCKAKHTNRLYQQDLSTLGTSVKKADSELKTIGDLANRNRDRMTNDQKEALAQKHNKYKENTQQQKELPKGMTRLKKQPKIKWT